MIMANSVLSLVLVFSCSLSLSSAVVTQLNSDVFDSFVRSHGTVLVDFFAPWCGHCMKMAPAYEEASSRLQMTAPDLSLAKVDCDSSGKMVCQRLGVNAFPTLLLFRNGMRVQGEYDGERSADGLVKYMMGQRGPSGMMFREAQPNQPILPRPMQPVRPQFMPQQQPRPNPQVRPNLPNAVNIANQQNAVMPKPAINPSQYPATLQRLTPTIVSQIIGMINSGKIHAKHHIPRVTDVEFKVTPDLANKVLAMMNSGELSPKNRIPKVDGGDDKKKPKAGGGDDKKKPQAGIHEVQATPDFISQLQKMINAARKKPAKGKGKKAGLSISIGPKGIKVQKSFKN